MPMRGKMVSVDKCKNSYLDAVQPILTDLSFHPCNHIGVLAAG